MTNKEACNVLMTLSNLVNVSKGWEDSAKSSVNEAVLKAIAALEERPHGEWHIDKSGARFCKFCGATELSAWANFCHNCGADMRQEEG